jgi:multimeric flavodoxin WrbA
MRVLGISTTTHTPNEEHPTPSTSVLALQYFLKICQEIPGVETRYIDAHKLHIVENMSCYSSDKWNCGGKDAGPYRCWAHKLSVEDPDAYGGVDEMPIIYDGIEWADAVIIATSVRWMNYSAVLQKVIERLNTLENRHSVYGEPNPLDGKKAGFIVSGAHYQTQEVGARLVEVFEQLGFTTESGYGVLTWQRYQNRNHEQEGSNTPHMWRYLKSDDGIEQIESLLKFIGVY